MIGSILNLDSMRLRIPDLLDERGMNAYTFAKATAGMLSTSTAYRLARGEWRCLSGEVMDVLCDVLGVEPGELFDRGAAAKRRGR